MAKIKKPAPKGGKKNAAPKKVAKKKPSKIIATVEEQWPQYQIVVPPKPSIWRRFRSAITGLFVSKQFAEAHPDTTVREKAD